MDALNQQQCGNADGDMAICMLNSLDNIIFRSIRESDLAELKELHEEFFPVRYNDDYYDSACREVGMNNGFLCTCIAECAITGQIAGFLFYQYISLDDCDDQDLIAEDILPSLLPKTATNSSLGNGKECQCVSYVLILGCRQEWRRAGLASLMMSSCIEKSSSNKNCIGVL